MIKIAFFDVDGTLLRLGHKELSANTVAAVLRHYGFSKDEANAFAKKATALMLYLKNHISIGYCAQIAGMSEEDFIKYLGNNNISIFSFDDEAEFIEEMNNA